MERDSQEKAVQEFEVREHVLPKFEVSITDPASIALNQRGFNLNEKLQINICAK